MMSQSNSPGQPISSIVLSVSEFVDLLNQTLDFAYPLVTIVGEISNFRINKNRWVYFDLKDELANIKLFGIVNILPGPLEDGLLVQISGAPRLHPKFGFSVNLRSVQAVGEGSIKRAASLLEAKLRSEGLFASERKRPLPYPPRRIGLIASSQSAAYTDFVKILGARWAGVEVALADVQVQGEVAPSQLVRAIEYFNNLPKPPEILVITRGGGSSEDLIAYNSESVTRAVASSRIPTLVAIGHEVDLSLAEMAADQRASTPSNAAELLTPDKRHEVQRLDQELAQLTQRIQQILATNKQLLIITSSRYTETLRRKIAQTTRELMSRQKLLLALAPEAILARGYAIVRSSNQIIRSGKQLGDGQKITVQLSDANVGAQVEDIQLL